MLQVTDFELIDHGIDHTDCFPGCGTAFSPFTCVQTGIGYNPREAMEDCLDMIAQADGDVDIDRLMRDILQEYNKGKPFPLSPRSTGECWYHISIRYNLP